MIVRSFDVYVVIIVVFLFEEKYRYYKHVNNFALTSVSEKKCKITAITLSLK